ncbi:MAG: integrin alpha [Marinicella sp.]
MRKSIITITLILAQGLIQTSVKAQFSSTLELGKLNGQNGYAIHGAVLSDYAGYSVSYAGDINNDGIDDIIIGALGADPDSNDEAGRSYVIFGSVSGFVHPLNLSNINGLNGLQIDGVAAFDHSGSSVSTAGDVNADGIDDIIIGARNASPNGNANAGSGYVVFGSDSPLPNPFKLANLNGLNGFQINGVSMSDETGISVSAAGDINADGIDDVLIGASSAGVDEQGRSYVVFGDALGFSTPFNLTSINALNGISLNGVMPMELSGHAVSSAGDFNGDGISDLIIGAYGAEFNENSQAGRTYMVYGRDTGLPNPYNLTTLDGTIGFSMNGRAFNDWSGFAVSEAGDVNADGFDDIIIGAYKASPNGKTEAGITYVVFGSISGLIHPFELRLLDGQNGFAVHGVAAGDLSGISVGSLGDVNGDQIDDFIVGASGASPLDKIGAGSCYVVFGTDEGFPHPFELATLNGQNGFVLHGINAGDGACNSAGGAGDVNADGIADILIGAGNASPNDISKSGSTYVVFGDDRIFKDSFDDGINPEE